MNKTQIDKSPDQSLDTFIDDTTNEGLQMSKIGLCYFEFKVAMAKYCRDMWF